MLARRLLMAAGGGGSIAAPEEDSMRVVAYLTRLQNVVHNNDVRFPWTTARVMDTAYCTWDGGASDGIVIVLVLLYGAFDVSAGQRLLLAGGGTGAFTLKI